MGSNATRRQVLGGLAATAAAAGLASPTSLAHAGDLSREQRLLAKFLGGLDIGDAFYGDWVLADAYAPMAGGVALIVAKGQTGDPVRIDAVARDEPAKAPAASKSLELFVMDRGGGVRVMPDDLIDALQVLVERLEPQVAGSRIGRHLLTHAQRLERYPDFMGRAGSELAPTPPGR